MCNVLMRERFVQDIVEPMLYQFIVGFIIYYYFE